MVMSHNCGIYLTEFVDILNEILGQLEFSVGTILVLNYLRKIVNQIKLIVQSKLTIDIVRWLKISHIFF